MRGSVCNLVSEEMLGAYLEGNLDRDSARAVELVMDANPELESLAADVVSSGWYDACAQPDLDAVDALDLNALLPDMGVELVEEIEFLDDSEVELVDDPDVIDYSCNNDLVQDANDFDFMSDDSGAIELDC